MNAPQSKRIPTLRKRLGELGNSTRSAESVATGLGKYALPPLIPNLVDARLPKLVF